MAVSMLPCAVSISASSSGCACLRRSSTSIPVESGRCRSSRATSWPPAPARCTASAPLPAVVTAMPWRSKRRARVWRSKSSSSTINSLRGGGSGVAIVHVRWLTGEGRGQITLTTPPTACRTFPSGESRGTHAGESNQEAPKGEKQANDEVARQDGHYHEDGHHHAAG